MVPVLVVAAAEQRVVVDDAAAVVDRRHVVADRADVGELDVLLHHTLAVAAVLGQPAARR